MTVSTEVVDSKPERQTQRIKQQPPQLKHPSNKPEKVEQEAAPFVEEEPVTHIFGLLPPEVGLSPFPLYFLLIFFSFLSSHWFYIRSLCTSWHSLISSCYAISLWYKQSPFCSALLFLYCFVPPYFPASSFSPLVSPSHICTIGIKVLLLLRSGWCFMETIVQKKLGRQKRYDTMKEW